MSLPSLTEKQLAFVEAKAIGMSSADAFRKAYPEQSAKLDASGIAIKACEINSNGKVQAWLEQIKVTDIKRIKSSRNDHLKRLRELSLKAEQKGQFAAAISAEKNIGLAQGLYVEKHEDVSKQADLSSIIELARSIGGEKGEKLASTLQELLMELMPTDTAGKPVIKQPTVSIGKALN